MDMQDSILSKTKTYYVVKEVKKLIGIARKKEIPVIYVRAYFRRGAPEISPNNKFLFENRDLFANADPAKWMQIPKEINPDSSDIIVDKRRIGSFEGSDLEMILRSKGYSHLILCGVGTSGVVLSTVREASDKDYMITVISDACADADPEIHDMLMKKIFPVQSTVLSIEQWQKSE
jgi:Amidases related to nicotinamidase